MNGRTAGDNDKCSPLLDAALQDEQTASATRPDVNTFYQGISPERNPDEWQAAQKRAAAAIRAWEANAPQAWKDARVRIDNLFLTVIESGRVYRAAYERQYKELETILQRSPNAPKNKLADLSQINITITRNYQKPLYQCPPMTLWRWAEKDWKLDAAETRKRITKALDSLHLGTGG